MARFTTEAKGEVVALACGDLHIAGLTPPCRDGNYLDDLCQKLEFVANHQAQYHCPVLFPGDIFHFWRQASPIINRVMPYFLRMQKQGGAFGVPGQHDSQMHAMTSEQMEPTAFATLVLSGALLDISKGLVERDGVVFMGSGWGSTPPRRHHSFEDRLVVWVAHVSTWDSPFMPGQTAGHATRLLMTLPVDYAVTGDNHQRFLVDCPPRDGSPCRRRLVNCGSIMRMRRDQVNHAPSLCELFSDGVRPRFVEIPLRGPLVTESRLSQIRDGETGVGEWVGLLKTTGGEATIGFEERVRMALPSSGLSQLAVKTVESSVFGE